MTNEQIQKELRARENQIRECEYAITRLRKQLEDEKKDDTIYVPENIVITKWGEDSYNLWFNEGNQQLWIDTEYGKGYSVSEIWNPSIEQDRKYKLIPCKRDQLKRGDLCYRSDNYLKDIPFLSNYCCILNDKEHVYIYNTNVFVSDYKCNYWYKVVEA